MWKTTTSGPSTRREVELFITAAKLRNAYHRADMAETLNDATPINSIANLLKVCNRRFHIMDAQMTIGAGFRAIEKELGYHD